MTQLISGLTGSGTMTGGIPATSSGGSSDLGFTLDQLINPTSAVDQTPQLTGGASSAPGFDPSLFSSGGPYGPTGSLSNAALGLPEVQQAVQDPAGQYPTDQTVDRTNKADRATTPTDQQTVDRSGKGDLQTALGVPPAGPTGFTRGGGDLTQLASAAGGGATTPAQQVAGRFPNMPAQPLTPADAARAQTRAAESQPTETAVPAPAAAPQPGAPGAPGAQRQAPGIPAPGGGRQPAPAAAAPPAGAPGPLQQAVQAAFGLGAPTTLSGIIPYLLQQLFGPGIPGVPGAPVAPFMAAQPGSRWRSGRLSQAYRRAHGLPDDTGTYTGSDQPERGTPTPGSDANATPPTEAQVRQSVQAGTDTAPTAGFSPYLAQQRSRFASELEDPRTRLEVAAIASLEHGGDPAAVIESLMNRAAYAGTSLRGMIHSGFYGPVNKGELGREMARLARNPTQLARMSAGAQTALRGSNLLGGATDQGSGNDPNVKWSAGRVRRFGEVYNDWGGGPGGHEGAARWRREQQSRVRAEMQGATPQERAANERGLQLAMDIGQRVPEMGSMLESDRGASAAARGGMRTAVTPEPGQMNRLEEERRKRTRRQEAVAL